MFKLIFWPLLAIWVIGLVAMIVRLWYFQIVLLNNMAQSEVRLNSAAFFDLDVWGMPFLTAPIGFPCLLVRLWSSLSPRRGNACRNLNLFLESASPAN